MEIVETSAGPRVRRGNRLVPIETHRRLEEENSARLRALHAEPGARDRLRARFKGLWADPQWRARFAKAQSARIRKINADIDADPARREKRSRERRATMAALNKDPEFQRRRAEGSRKGYAKRDAVALAAHHKNVTVQTINGPVVMRAWQARLFEQYRHAIGDPAALAKIVRKPKRRKKPKALSNTERRLKRAVRAARLAERQDRRSAPAVVLHAELAPRVAKALDISLVVLCGPTRGCKAVATARALLMLLMYDVYGLTSPAIGAAMRRDHTSVLDVVHRARAGLKRDPAMRSTYETIATVARASPMPPPASGSIVEGRDAA